MDLSGSMQGAGGVGGLLSVNDGSNTYYPTFDGNGNVSEYVDATGAVVAHYEYDAFGQVVASGMKKDDFSHQFSTKMLDAESGLHYYGYRYYDSSNGRWLGRDSIQERGGINIYGFVGNQGISRWDLLGLVWPGGYPINPTNPTPPTQPNVCDQINPFGCRGDGKADYNKWLEGRFSKSIHKAKSALGVSIDTRVQKLCFNKGNTVDVSKIGYGLSNDNIEDNGDEGQSLWERAATVGSFSLYAENVSITWKEENGKCLYEWTATIYVEENTGATNPFNTNYQCYCPDLLWFTGMFVERKLRWAEWEVEGSGQCGETVYSSQ